MLLAGQADIEVPLKRLWAALLDVNEIAACMPGLDSVRQLDDRTFEGAMAAQLGPMAGRFTFRATIVETNEPGGSARGREAGSPRGSMRFVLDGVEQTTGSRMVTSTTLTVSAAAPQTSRLEYVTRVDLDGRLAIVGEMVMRATARLVLREFAARLRRRLAVIPG